MKKKLLLSTLAATVLFLASDASAQSSRPARGDRGPGNVPPAQPDKKAMEEKVAEKGAAMAEAPMDMAEYAAMMENATPKAAKEWNRRSEGRWTGTGWMLPGPGAPKMEITSVDQSEIVGTWLMTRVDSNFGGMEMKGFSQSGWDMFEKKMVVTWVDSMAPYITIGKGEFVGADTLKVEMLMKDGMTGKDVPTTMTTTFQGEDMYSMTMTCKTEDGTSFDMMHIDYKRSE